jgi:cytochrome c oxidase cbb3-type subunit 3
MERGAENSRYHSAANGWPNHERYRAAYPFALGEIPLDRPEGELDAEQRQGRALFLTSCISCHDRARVEEPGPIWDARALSFPRGGYSHRPEQRLDAISRATPFAQHDIPPTLEGLTPQQRRGESLFQANCAFCHGADGTGKNWIGSFLEPHPRNLTDPQQMAGMDRARLRGVIREGLPGTTMPAWKSVLKAGEIEALIAYIDRAFHPLGK